MSAFESDPVVTIVVPTYKRPDLLEQCLREISRQTYGRFVVFVCDNSVQREAEPVVAALRDKRFEYVPRTRNVGMLENVLMGFRDARTEFVMEVDDDDLLYPHCLETLLAPFSECPHITISFADLDVIDDDLVVMSDRQRVKYLPSLETLEEGIHRPFTDLAAYGYVFLMASILRRDCIDWNAVPASVATAYDRYLTLVASRADAAGHFTPRRVMAYRVHERSDGLRFTTQCLNGALEVLTREVPTATVASRPSIELEVTRTRLRLVRAYRASGDTAALRRQLRKLLSPGGVRALAVLARRRYLPARAPAERSQVHGYDDVSRDAGRGR